MSRLICNLFKVRHVKTVAKLPALVYQGSCRTYDFYISPTFISCRYMAGHSKWQNIKHTKAEKDREKAYLCGKYGHLVRQAVKEGGSDPKHNKKLADILAEARSKNVPGSTLESAMKKASSGKVKSGLIEILGPGGCYVVIDYETDNISETRHDIKVICKKYGASIVAGEGRWRAFYEQKGILKVTRTKDDQPLCAEKALDVAIEAGAEDVQLKTSEEDGTQYLEFYTEPSDLYSVKKVLEESSYCIEDAYIGFIPNVTVELSDEVMAAAGSFIAEIGDMHEIVRIYENVQ